MRTEILTYINRNTHRENLEEKSTKQIADKFGMTTAKAYDVLSSLANERAITKLDPVNGDNFSCCGWIRNTDPE